MNDVVLRMRGIGKLFPGVEALAGVDFALRSGSVHAIVGENGGGKVNSDEDFEWGLRSQLW